MLVPAIETLTLLASIRLNEPALSARTAVSPLPLTVPEIDGPADVDEGPTGDSEAFPPHAATATIIAARMIRFITPILRGAVAGWASRSEERRVGKDGR